MNVIRQHLVHVVCDEWCRRVSLHRVHAAAPVVPHDCHRGPNRFFRSIFHRGIHVTRKGRIVLVHWLWWWLMNEWINYIIPLEIVPFALRWFPDRNSTTSFDGRQVHRSNCSESGHEWSGRDHRLAQPQRWHQRPESVFLTIIRNVTWFYMKGQRKPQIEIVICYSPQMLYCMFYYSLLYLYISIVMSSRMQNASNILEIF